MTRWGWLSAGLAAIALGASGCTLAPVGPSAGYVLALDPTAAYAAEVAPSVARALAGQGWVPVAVEAGSVVTEWRDLVGEGFPRRRILGRLVVTLEPDRLVLRLETRALSAGCGGVPHPPTDLSLVGCPKEGWSPFFVNSSLEALAAELAFALDTAVVAAEPGDPGQPLF